MRVGSCISRPVWRGAGIEPITELETLVPQSLLASEAGDEIDPHTHALELLGQNARIAVALVKHPGHEHRGITPGSRRYGGHGYDVGDNKWYDASCSVLLGSQVRQPRGKESSAVVEEASRGCEYLDVAGPAQALVALRAIGRDAEEVAAHAPHHILVEPVDQWVRALEPPSALHIGMADHRVDIVYLQLPGPAFHLGVTEAMEGEARFPGLHASPP